MCTVNNPSQPYRTLNLLKMKALGLLVCLAVCCLAQKPLPCLSPPLLSGSFYAASQNGKLLASVNYTYDALQQRIRLHAFGEHDDKPFHFDVLLLYKDGILYELNYENQTCHKERLDTSFHPLKIPSNASFVGQTVLGSISGPGEGVLINTWAGELQTSNGTVKYLTTVTDLGCIPISSLFVSSNNEGLLTSFFNNVVGIPNPQRLIPPPFCKDAQLEEDEDSFFTLF